MKRDLHADLRPSPEQNEQTAVVYVQICTRVEEHASMQLSFFLLFRSSLVLQVYDMSGAQQTMQNKGGPQHRQRFPLPRLLAGQSGDMRIIPEPTAAYFRVRTAVRKQATQHQIRCSSDTDKQREVFLTYKYAQPCEKNSMDDSTGCEMNDRASHIGARSTRPARSSCKAEQLPGRDPPDIATATLPLYGNAKPG